MPDGETIVGVDLNTKNNLVNEDITTNKSSTFGKHENPILTLLYDEVTASLFAGDFTGRIKQYRRGNSKQFFSLVKDYGNLSIGMVFSCAQVGGIALFGACKNYLIGINIHEGKLCTGQIKSPFYHTYSLQVCQGADQKVYLSLGGNLPDYSSSKSDFLEVTKIDQKQKEFTEFTKKWMQTDKENKKIRKKRRK